MSVPTLIFDGECAFCRYWVEYWTRLVGTRVEFRPYQTALADFPALDPARCRNAVQYIDVDGTVLSGAAASFAVLRQGGHPVGAACYRHSALFARVSEAAYAFVARHRGLAYRISRLLWGARRVPADFHAATECFIRGLGAIYVCAFLSFALQGRGLVGADGILPLQEYLALAHGAYGTAAYWRLPMVFWAYAGDPALYAVCGVGAACGLALLFGRWRLPAAALAYALYLSLFYAGQVFTSFQWDLLLLECGFLALLAPSGHRWVPIAIRALLFKFMFLSGCVKLLSGDLSWANLSALSYHFETQPLPTALAWYAHRLPEWLGRAGVAATFLIELGLPWCIFGPRRLRLLSATGFVLLEVLILLTGNYNFFNYLTILLCVSLIADDDWPRRWASLGTTAGRRPPRPARRAAGIACIFLLLADVYWVLWTFERDALPAWTYAAMSVIEPLQLDNGYGLFAVMTTTRPEIVVEGSDDGVHWLAYEFRYKPGDLARRPRVNQPHQPRLDWQMWFAALGSADRNPWFEQFLQRLLTNSKPVVELLERSPFGASPPRYVRALLYQYRYTTPAERAQAGDWWQRELLGVYYPQVKLPGH